MHNLLRGHVGKVRFFPKRNHFSLTEWMRCTGHCPDCALDFYFSLTLGQEAKRKKFQLHLQQQLKGNKINGRSTCIRDLKLP